MILRLVLNLSEGGDVYGNQSSVQLYFSMIIHKVISQRGTFQNDYVTILRLVLNLSEGGDV